MKIRLLIKGDAIQYGENDFYCPCRTIDVYIADNLIDKEHEHIIGVEVEPQESEKINCKSTKCENCINHNYCDYEPQERSDKE